VTDGFIPISVRLTKCSPKCLGVLGWTRGRGTPLSFKAGRLPSDRPPGPSPPGYCKSAG
jgi:hypothetical protein